MSSFRRAILPGGVIGALGVAGGGLYASWNNTLQAQSNVSTVTLNETIPTRDSQIAALRKAGRDNPFDTLIVGGGATGTGCAVDSATRGLRTALIEREDFASGTSSKSTKLVHGGVRYLEKAVFNLDYSQLKLVFEALHERHHILTNAAHLSSPLAILTPCYAWWEVPYYWAGMKAYDLVAGRATLVLSKFLSTSESVARLPTLADTRPDGKTLKGAILYYDGQFDDARLCVTLAITAAAAGATTSNYVECKSLIKDEQGQVIGAHVVDRLTGEEMDVFAKVVINATGVFTDAMRQQSDKNAGKITLPSSGVHITLPDYYGANTIGLLVPKTDDGRVVFMLPWLDRIIAGTTDTKCEVTMRPKPTEEEINFILETLAPHLSIKVRREDVLSAWSGIRPLAVDPRAKNTQSVSRDHVVHKEADGMITVVGGKWTTYRLMASDTMAAVMQTGRLPASTKPCQTEHVKLLGSQKYTPQMLSQVAQTSSQYPNVDLETDVARHLVRSYGDRTGQLVEMAQARGLGQRLATGHPHLEAEVVWAVHNEYCQTVEDFIARRTRLAFLDVAACRAAIPRVAELMAGELQWGGDRVKAEVATANRYLSTFEPEPAKSAEMVADIKAAKNVSSIA